MAPINSTSVSQFNLPFIAAPGPFYVSDSWYTCNPIEFTVYHGFSPYYISLVNASNSDFAPNATNPNLVQTIGTFYEDGTYNFSLSDIPVGWNASLEVIDSHAQVFFSSVFPGERVLPADSINCTSNSLRQLLNFEQIFVISIAAFALALICYSCWCFKSRKFRVPVPPVIRAAERRVAERNLAAQLPVVNLANRAVLGEEIELKEIAVNRVDEVVIPIDDGDEDWVDEEDILEEEGKVVEEGGIEPVQEVQVELEEVPLELTPPEYIARELD